MLRGGGSGLHAACRVQPCSSGRNEPSLLACRLWCSGRRGRGGRGLGGGGGRRWGGGRGSGRRRRGSLAAGEGRDELLAGLLTHSTERRELSEGHDPAAAGGMEVWQHRSCGVRRHSVPRAAVFARRPAHATPHQQPDLISTNISALASLKGRPLGAPGLCAPCLFHRHCGAMNGSAGLLSRPVLGSSSLPRHEAQCAALQLQNRAVPPCTRCALRSNSKLVTSTRSPSNTWPPPHLLLPHALLVHPRYPGTLTHSPPPRPHLLLHQYQRGRPHVNFLGAVRQEDGRNVACGVAFLVISVCLRMPVHRYLRTTMAQQESMWDTAGEGTVVRWDAQVSTAQREAAASSTQQAGGCQARVRHMERRVRSATRRPRPRPSAAQRPLAVRATAHIETQGALGPVPHFLCACYSSSCSTQPAALLLRCPDWTRFAPALLPTAVPRAARATPTMSSPSRPEVPVAA